MLKKIVIVVAVLIVGFLAFVASRPGEFRVERSAHMMAPASVVFENVNTLSKWVAWSPWEKLDPSMQKEFWGPVSGVGAAYHWTSNNDQVGEGRMTIVESQPDALIGIKLEFIKPFEATNDTTFAFHPMDGATHVIWAMSGRNNFTGKLFHVFMDMDKMVGGDFEKGLASLKAISEDQAKALAAAAQPATTPTAATAPTEVP